MKTAAAPRILLAAISLLLIAAPGASAASGATSTAAPAAKTATPAKARAAADASAAERRAASSKFESEKLDQSAFDKGDTKASATKQRSGGGSVFRALFGLIVVVGAIYAVHWLLKKWGQSKLDGVGSGRTGIIDVVATTPLAQGRALHLVRVGDELVLVGATDQSITRLGEVDGRAAMDVAGNRGAADFQSMLSGALLGQQPGVPSTTGTAGAGKQTFLRRFVDNLRLTTAR